ncbi:glycosyltransferase family 4 protein [Microbacter margulisiae]|uniref:Glycosyltransferase involved in cell wall biosynthesis n=1 Tax=Microbacter margulisiae TaxID=1350067 RepID=A0A7W5H151_9PORP|nr:glycosyltransferase family 4 protein [Microbacter margulisiae]MBB3185976.1 glycosyltransferase involved in cell wall biosynthesis [Microbacter margulisiae]
MKKIVLINQSSGYLMIDIANAFVQSGKFDEVVLIAGRINPIKIPLDNRIKVTNIISYHRSSTIKRMLSWGIATLQVFLLLLFKFRTYEIFFVSNPPTLVFLSPFLKHHYSALVYDVYPDGAVLGGFITEKSILYRWWAQSTIQFYAKAHRVFTITPGMAQTIATYCPPTKITVVPVWSSNAFDTIIQKAENQFIQNEHLVNQFVVMYSGNIGKGQGLEALVEVADQLRDESNLLFLFIGEGWGKTALINRVNELQLESLFRFLPYQDANQLPHSLSAADMAVIATPKEAGRVCVPSKTYNLLKLGKALLCITGKDSELYRLVNEYGVGKCFEQDEINEIAHFIRLCKHNPERIEQYAKKSTSYALTVTASLANQFVE